MKTTTRSITTGTIIGIFLFGMAIGYIAGLWQQVAQKAHRINCQVCREYTETDK